MSTAGYITEVNELYIFARSVNQFCNEFKNGCIEIGNSHDEDYSIALRQLIRLRERLATCRDTLESLEREYDYYSDSESKDPGRAASLKIQMEDARAELVRAQNDLNLAEVLFQEFRTLLSEIQTSANRYAYSVSNLGNEASRAITGAARFIENEYNDR